MKERRFVSCKIVLISTISVLKNILPMKSANEDKVDSISNCFWNFL